MKTVFLTITVSLLVTGMFVISPAYASFTDSILIQISGDFKKLYYNEKNVSSVLFDPSSGSVIFETEGDAMLEIKAPKIYQGDLEFSF